MSDDLCVDAIDVRVGHLLFDGVVEPEGGVLRPADDRPGLGVSLKATLAERYPVA